MKSFGKFKNFILMLSLGILGIIVIWLVVKLVFGPTTNQSQLTNLLAGVDITGTVKSIDGSSLVVVTTDQGEQTLVLTSATIFEVRNPQTYLFDPISQQYVVPGMTANVHIKENNQSPEAELVQVDYLTSLGGRVVEVDDNILTLADYKGDEYIVEVTENSIVFIRGQGDNLSVADIRLEKNIIVTSARSYESGIAMEAGWVEILDESLYTVPIEALTTVQ